MLQDRKIEIMTALTTAIASVRLKKRTPKVRFDKLISPGRRLKGAQLIEEPAFSEHPDCRGKKDRKQHISSFIDRRKG